MNTKLLALKRLGIEPTSNSSRTNPEIGIEPEEGCAGRKFEDIEGQDSTVRKYGHVVNRTSNIAYHFKLKGDEGGGTYITDTPDLGKARDSLLERYGGRLLAATKVE